MEKTYRYIDRETDKIDDVSAVALPYMYIINFKYHTNKYN